MGLFDFMKKGKNNKQENSNEQEMQVENAIDMESLPLEEETVEAELTAEEPTPEECIQADLARETLAEADAPPIEEAVEETMEESFAEEEKVGFFKKIFSGLDKTRKNILSGVENVLKNFTTIDEELFEELEEVLIMADIGVDTSLQIIGAVRERVKKEKTKEVSQIKGLIVDEITAILTEDDTPLDLTPPSVLLVIGVNGAGKTTTIGKLANIYKQKGNKVLLAAADTFRAAAIDQLEVWGKRANIDVIAHQAGADPAAVVYDGVAAARARKADLLIIDTAGRLHNKKNLMDELAKIFRVIQREYAEAHLEVFLVLDATTGQNALQQAKIFKEAAGITGIVLTKLDGTAKGGVVIAIKNELKLPVRFVGVGEKIDDLQEFVPQTFAEALFSEERS